MANHKQLGEGFRSRVYFVIADDVQLVKIGTAVDPVKRLQGIQAHSPIPVRLYGHIPGGLQVERWCQFRCFEDRSHFEWFRWTDRVRLFAEHLVLHGESASTLLCPRHLRTDHLFHAGRRPEVLLPPLPFASAHIAAYLDSCITEADPYLCPECDGAS